MLRSPFGLTVNGNPIDEYQFLPAPASISYDLKFEEEEARVAAGMSIAEYDALPGTPDWATDTRSKSHIIVWYRYSRRIQAIPQDIQNRKMLRNRKGK